MNVKLVYAEEWEGQSDPPMEVIKIKNVVKPETILKKIILKIDKSLKVSKIFVTEDIYLKIYGSSNIKKTLIMECNHDYTKKFCGIYYESLSCFVYIDKSLAK